MSEINLSVNLCGIQLANPAILASGILGTTKALLKRVAENGAGAVTIKSISVESGKDIKILRLLPLRREC